MWMSLASVYGARLRTTPLIARFVLVTKRAKSTRRGLASYQSSDPLRDDNTHLPP